MSRADECRSQLREIPELHALSSKSLTPGNGGRGSSSGEPTIGINLEALDYSAATDSILGYLEPWEDLIREQRPGLEEREADTPRGSIDFRVKHICEFLQVNFEWLMQHELATDFIREVSQVHLKGLAVTNQIPMKKTRVECPNDLEDGTLCGGRIILNSTEIDSEVTCRICQRVWTIGWLVRVATASSESHIFVDVEVLVEHYGISASAVKKFARRNNVKTMQRHPVLYSFTEFSAKKEASAKYQKQAEGA